MLIIANKWGLHEDYKEAASFSQKEHQWDLYTMKVEINLCGRSRASSLMLGWHLPTLLMLTGKCVYFLGVSLP